MDKSNPRLYRLDVQFPMTKLVEIMQKNCTERRFKLKPLYNNITSQSNTRENIVPYLKTYIIQRKCHTGVDYIKAIETYQPAILYHAIAFYIHTPTHLHPHTYTYTQARIQGGGARGPWPPPPAHKKLLPQIVRRGSRGAKKALPPPPGGGPRGPWPPLTKSWVRLWHHTPTRTQNSWIAETYTRTHPDHRIFCWKLNRKWVIIKPLVPSGHWYSFYVEWKVPTTIQFVGIIATVVPEVTV